MMLHNDEPRHVINVYFDHDQLMCDLAGHSNMKLQFKSIRACKEFARRLVSAAKELELRVVGDLEKEADGCVYLTPEAKGYIDADPFSKRGTT
jgi:hypothetical protein